jgi:hypothetical protein
MKKFKVYFEIFGKKMKTSITANSREEAKQLLMKKIIFHKVELDEDFKLQDDDVLDFLKGAFKMK